MFAFFYIPRRRHAFAIIGRRATDPALKSLKQGMLYISYTMQTNPDTKQLGAH